VKLLLVLAHYLVGQESLEGLCRQQLTQGYTTFYINQDKLKGF
jgi:hypothetical protein